MIRTEKLSKSYGKTRALRDVSICVEEGDIYGLIGPNGAGKSTLFRIVSTILKPDKGSAQICGVDLKKGDKIRSLIGYMPDVFGVYEDMTVREYLEFFAAAYYIPAKRRGRLVKDVLELTDLGFKSREMVRALSRGMQQRLGVARVLVHDPKVLILDEPASGLDPRARIELRELIRELRNLGKTILISSHILVELSEICNRIGIIESGEMVFEGSREDLEEKLRGHSTTVFVEVGADMEAAQRFLSEHPAVNGVAPEGSGLSVQLKEGETPPQDLLADLVKAGHGVTRFDPARVSLEEAFMVLTKGKLA